MTWQYLTLVSHLTIQTNPRLLPVWCHHAPEETVKSTLSVCGVGGLRSHLGTENQSSEKPENCVLSCVFPSYKPHFPSLSFSFSLLRKKHPSSLSKTIPLASLASSIAHQMLVETTHTNSSPCLVRWASLWKKMKICWWTPMPTMSSTFLSTTPTATILSVSTSSRYFWLRAVERTSKSKCPEGEPRHGSMMKLIASSHSVENWMSSSILPNPTSISGSKLLREWANWGMIGPQPCVLTSGETCWRITRRRSSVMEEAGRCITKSSKSFLRRRREMIRTGRLLLLGLHSCTFPKKVNDSNTALHSSCSHFLLVNTNYN